MFFLDFAKALDTVPHQKLLKKLEYYKIDEKMQSWSTEWLTKRMQRVLVKGCESDYVPVISGVPQDTVLEPLVFLLYINDVNSNILSSIQLFADDCVTKKKKKNN